MYTAFYGLREKPFALSPNPRFLYLSESHREALAHLLYGVEQREGFIAITGEVGTGKTTLCRTLIERLGPDTDLAYLFNPSRSAKELMEAIASELALPSAGLSLNQLHDQLNRVLLEKSRAGARVLLIVDEAQNLSIETLEQVRLLSNLETSSSKLIQILLLGQPELDRKLDSRELRQLRQRIGVRWSLAPLSAEETRRYVAYRLRVAAGAEREIFTRGALREIHRATKGIPRLINVLCDRALLAGYAAKMHEIPAKLIRKAAREIDGVRSQTVHPRASGWMRRWLPLAAAIALLALAGAAGLYGVPSLRQASLRLLSAEAPVAAGSRPRTESTATAPGELGEALAPRLPGSPTASTSADASDVAFADLPPAVSAGVPLGPTASEVLESARPVRAEDEPVAMGLSRLENRSLLGGVLSQHDPDWARLRATNAVLESFGQPGLSVPPEDEAHLLQLLEWSGLSVLSIPQADFGTLRALNHPTLITLRADDGDERLVALLGLDEELALLRGASGRGDLSVLASEVRSHWNGRALVVWRAFEAIPSVLSRGENGDAVAWLQASLQALGYYPSGPSGQFDETTQDGLIAFQRSRHLEPDGEAGPRTQMVLYDLLGDYAVPRLSGATRPNRQEDGPG